MKITRQDTWGSGARRLLGEERGIVMPVSLMVVIILGALAGALLGVGALDVQVSANHLQATQAQLLAEAALEDAIGTFVAAPQKVSQAPPQFQALQLAGAGIADTGTYSAQYRRAGLDTALVVATGTTQTGGAQRVMRAIVSTTFFSNDAIRSREGLVIAGNPIIKGKCGSAHANGDILISGNPTVTGNVTASGELDVTGTPIMGPGSGEHMPQKPVPAIVPSNFLAKAQQLVAANEIFQCKANGWVLDGNGNVIAILMPGQEYRGWKYTPGSPPLWELGGNTAYDGTYYIEGDAMISGNPGNPADPWKTTIISTEDIIISGTPSIDTHLRDTFLVAGKDVKINGNPNQRFEGLIAAHEQVGISGNPTIEGYIIAESMLDTSGTVTGTGVNGNPTIIYDCNLNPPLDGPPQIVAVGP